MDDKLLEQNTPKLEATSMDELIRDWSSLPIELLRLIVSPLSPKDFERFSCVCKGWNSVPYPPVPCPTQCPIPQSQWLMLYRGFSKMELNFLHPLYKDTYRMDIPELSDALLRCSKDGWLLMSRGNRLFFFNPFTKAKIDLPDLPHRYYFHAISFSCAPTSSDCMVFGIRGYYEINYSFISRGEEKWSVDQSRHKNGFPPSNSNPVFYKELVYCLCEDGTLGVFDPKKKSWKALPNPEKFRDFAVYENYLMESDGKLLAVFVGNKGRGVSIYGLDDSKMVWERIRDLGNKMLFVSHEASISATKVVKGMENKIYFPRLCGKRGVFFSLATNKYESFGSRLSQKDFRGMDELLHCCWIEPRTETCCEEELNWLSTID